MYKLIRFYNQNRKKFLIIILIIVFIICIIQLLNYLEKNKNTNIITQNNIVETENLQNQLISDKSAISGEKISNKKLEKATEVIEEFMNYCNNNDINSAYNLLTNECKEEMFPIIDDFINIYYSSIFNGENKSYTVENWIGDTYQVRIIGDILSTGKLNNTETIQDYITVKEDKDGYKLNINNYVGRTQLDKVTENKDIKITAVNKDTYIDYEIYNLKIENNSKNNIMLDTSDDTKSIYLLDSKDMKYYFYNNEIINTKLLVQSSYTNNIQIKFTNSYSSSRKIRKLVFSKMILNYEDYSILENKSDYKDMYIFEANV